METGHSVQCDLDWTIISPFVLFFWIGNRMATRLAQDDSVGLSWLMSELFESLKIISCSCKTFVSFLFEFCVVVYSQDLIPKNNAPTMSSEHACSMCPTGEDMMNLNSEMGRGDCCFTGLSRFSYPRSWFARDRYNCPSTRMGSEWPCDRKVADTLLRSARTEAPLMTYSCPLR